MRIERKRSFVTRARRARRSLVLATVVALAVAPGPVSALPGYTVSDSVVPADVMAASAAPGHSWEPETASYGVGANADASITMSDGTVLRADVYYPTDVTGQQAPGQFPVVLMQTPYGKSNLDLVNRISGALGLSSDDGTPEPLGNANTLSLGAIGPNDYMVQRGYISVVADVRGTGHSQGVYGMFDPVQATDGMALVDWASTLPGSNGKVGLYGASAMGIIQLITAGAAPKDSPLKAIFPVLPAHDLYKDTVTMGGLIDLEFDLIFAGATGALNIAGPVLGALLNPTNLPADFDLWTKRLGNVADFQVDSIRRGLQGDPNVVYNDDFWQARNPRNVLANIVSSDIPAYIVGSQYDLFQRGQPLLYTGLQNAYSGRPVDAPMTPAQRVTGRYQLLMGPYAHAATATLQDFDPLMLRWFDTWLKGKDTGMADTPTPLHYSDIGTSSYGQHAIYPFPDAKPTRYYFNNARAERGTQFGNSGSLTTTPAEVGDDTLAWTPVSNPCTPSTDQWSGGIPSWLTGFFASSVPCVNTDIVGQAGLDRLTYTTAPLTQAQTIAGPIAATVFAKATTTETAWIGRVDDVAPDGTITPLTQGALLGSLRAIDPATTWTDSDGQIFKSGHTYSRSVATPVIPGESTRYDIDIFPTYATIAPGHSIRVTLSTADTPHLLPTFPDQAKLATGVYTIELGGPTGSAIELPLIPAS
ncbi:CocE/NonD family hydrolase [Antrihabitans stalactiti]|nr:CocE/NonD family hydrolase [Antrihabitans stalactiti]